MQEPVVFVFAELEALSVRFRNKPLNLVKKCVATSLLYLERFCARCEERQQQRCIDAAASQVET
jgi:hypothetical protein